MHSLISKITSTLTAIAIVGSNLMPALVYAANYIPDDKVDDDIIFDAKINSEYSYVANIDEHLFNSASLDGQLSNSANADEQLSLDINLAITNNGYIKDGQITIEDNNYKIGDIKSTEENDALSAETPAETPEGALAENSTGISASNLAETATENTNFQKINDNTIELNQINSQEQINISLPISFEKNDVMDSSYFERDSKVKLNATYVKDNGKQEQITKEINLHLKWDAEVEGSINQELKRYLKYENKTLVSFLVSSGIKDNKLPVSAKTVQILVPLINNMEPSKIIVSGNQDEYSYQNQVLVINKKYNEIQWNSNDEYLVTYIYDTQAEEINIETLAVMLAKTIVGKDVEARTDNLSYHAQEALGNLVEASIVGDNEINKGYMYTNLNRSENKLETPFKSSYKINIGLTDFVDEIQIKENPSEYETATKRIAINGEEFVQIFGEEGSIRVLSTNNEELGILNKDNLQLDVNQYGLKFITSKPVQEGDITIYLEKIINPNLSYTREILSQVNTLNNSIEVIGIFQGQEISNSHITKTINLIEPESQATISISRENLSTVVTNEDVVITATLERNDISDSLYTDPQILITLPEQVTNVTLKDAKLIYEDELVPVDFRMVEKQIYLKLQGTQTMYSNIPNANGTVVRIVADIDLDNLAVNSNEKVTLQYTNQARNELKTVEVPINIVAPTGFVTANMGALSQTVTAINEDATIQIPVYDKEKTIRLGGTIVSNLQENASGLMILGRIPSQDTSLANTSNEKTDSTFSTTLTSRIEVSGLDADIYYSDNGMASYDLQDQENAWSLDAKDTSKSYLIVAKGEVTPAQKVNFAYNVNAPRNLGYENRAISSYAVYYDNKAENGINKNAILAKSISIATENLPIIKTEITAKYNNSQEAINEGDAIHLGQLIQYTIHVTNSGKKAAEKVTVKVQRPEETTFYITTYDSNSNSYETNHDESAVMSYAIDKINPGETKDVDVVIEIPKWAEQNSMATIKTEVTAENMLENSTAILENTITSGTLELNISPIYTLPKILINDEISYNISLENNKFEDLNNVSVKINIPKYLDITEAKDGTFDEKTRTLTYTLEKLDIYKTYTLKAKVTHTDEPNQEIKLTGTATFDGMEKAIKSNTCINTVTDTKGFSATLSSNITGKMIDTDTVEYYVNVKNDSKKSAEIAISEELPKELELISYTVKNKNTGYTKENTMSLSAFNVNENVEAGQTLKVTIIAKPYLLDSVGQIKDFESNVYVSVNGLKLDINSVNQQIEGTSNFNTVYTKQNNEEQGNIYSISGKIWYDENADSKQDASEIKMSNIPLNLYSVTGKSLLKNEDGSILEVYTNDNGEYKFDNLGKGQYIVIAKYDNEKYELANYQSKDSSQNEDSDFIESDNKEAITNVITISEGNVYNIDLGLVDKPNFNITLQNNISKINVINGKETKTYDYNTELANIELNKKENVTLVIEYSIKAVNNGNVEGYVTNIANYIPQGMQFISELNENWYVDSNGDAINTSLANTLIKPGETQELKLILVKNVSENDVELLHNMAEIRGTYNKYGVTTSQVNLKKNNAKSADIIINESTNLIIPALISICIIAIMAVIGIGVYKYINR